MSDTGSGGDWFSGEWLWEGVKYVISAVVTIASSAMLWLAARYRGDRAMLLRHDELLKANDIELGEHKEFRKAAKVAPVGEALIKQIDELKKEDRRLHVRISRNKAILTDLQREHGRMQTDISWIREELQRKKDQE